MQDVICWEGGLGKIVGVQLFCLPFSLAYQLFWLYKACYPKPALHFAISSWRCPDKAKYILHSYLWLNFSTSLFFFLVDPEILCLGDGLGRGWDNPLREPQSSLLSREAQREVTMRNLLLKIKMFKNFLDNSRSTSKICHHKCNIQLDIFLFL